MQHRARGPRPRYFEDSQLDRFHDMFMVLVEEVAVLRDRLDTIERLGAGGGRFSLADIDSFEPDERAAAERLAWREAYIDRVLRVVFEEARQLQEGGSPFATVEDVIEAVSK